MTDHPTLTTPPGGGALDVRTLSLDEYLKRRRALIDDSHRNRMRREDAEALDRINAKYKKEP